MTPSHTVFQKLFLEFLYFWNIFLIGRKGLATVRRNFGGVHNSKFFAMKSTQMEKTSWVKAAMSKKRATVLDDGKNQTLESFITPLSPRSLAAKEARAQRRLEEDQAAWEELNRLALEREAREREQAAKENDEADVDSRGSFTPDARSWLVPCTVAGCRRLCENNIFCDECFVATFFEVDNEPESQPFE